MTIMVARIKDKRQIECCRRQEGELGGRRHGGSVGARHMHGHANKHTAD